MAAVARLTSDADFDAIRAEWDRLAERCGPGTPFQSFTWLRTWWDTLRDGRDLYLLVVHHRSQTLGIAPFMRTRGQDARRRSGLIEFLGTPNADYQDVLALDGSAVADAVADHLSRHRRAWSRVRLRQFPSNSTTPQLLRLAFRKRGLPAAARPGDVCSRYEYRGAPSAAVSFAMRRSRSVHTKINWMERRGGVRLAEYCDEGDILARLPHVFDLHVRRWSRTNHPSKFLRVEHRRFHEEYVRRTAPQHGTRLFSLEVGGRPVAYTFSLMQDDRAYMYTLTYDVDMAARSPGTVLACLLGEHLIRQGFRVIDYTRGAESYKEAVTNHRTWNRDLDVFAGHHGLQAANGRAALRTLVHRWAGSGFGRRFAAAWRRGVPAARGVDPAGG